MSASTAPRHEQVRRDGRARLIEGMPKVELHVHLEGCLEPEMALRFARKNRVAYPYDSVEEARRGMRFSDLGSFISAMSVNTQTLRTVEDHYDLTLAYLERSHAENVAHVELAMSPQGFELRGLEIGACIAAVGDAFSYARRNFGMTGGIIAGCMRHRAPEEAMAMLQKLSTCGDRVLAVGLHGAEQARPPSAFSEHFEFARAQGWRTVAHAGEEGPADYVRQALDVLKAERIDHGVRADEDSALVQRLIEEQVPLTVCPVSNVYLGVVQKLEEHNLARLLRAGVQVSLHSDDPAYFGGYLTDHFVRTANALDLNTTEIATLNENAIRASFLDAEQKARLLQLTQAALASARTQTNPAPPADEL